MVCFEYDIIIPTKSPTFPQFPRARRVFGKILYIYKIVVAKNILLFKIIKQPFSKIFQRFISKYYIYLLTFEKNFEKKS